MDKQGKKSNFPEQHSISRLVNKEKNTKYLLKESLLLNENCGLK
jgi:hypothetical protein